MHPVRIAVLSDTHGLLRTELLPLLAKHRLTMGFRAAEARQARRVVVLAAMDDVPLEVESELRAAGCEVVRVIPAASPGMTEQRLAEALGEKGLAVRFS